jgi:CIC family chloride channel protein
MFLPMLPAMIRLATQFRLAMSRLLLRLGLREDSFLYVVAILIGLVTAGAAVGFHTLIDYIRNYLYGALGPRADLYGKGILLLIALPAIGGLAVGVISRFVFRDREGHGVVDVLEAVNRSSGFIHPLSAVEKILTSAITIGTGGSAGAEGPIVQIGAGIASGAGQLFRIARQHLPLLIGCGSAAGISAIFNSPIGGVFFTMEVILLDFSMRTFMPVVLASVIANVATKAIYAAMGYRFEAILALSPWEISSQTEFAWHHVTNFIVLGMLCGLVGVALTRSMDATERLFARLRLPRWIKPGVGGALLGMIGILYVVGFGWWMLDKPKPIDVGDYPLPAFFSDGYGVVRQLTQSVPDPKIDETPPPPPIPTPANGAPPTAAPPAPAPAPPIETPVGPQLDVRTPLHGFYAKNRLGLLLLLLGSLCILKVLATCLTLGSGGSGGIIAPSLVLGAVAGGFLGVLLRVVGTDVQPFTYALVGMGAVLAAVVHAPLASILIVLDLTHDYKLILPAMLATVIATGFARLIYRDSIYTASLRARGVRVGTDADLKVLRRLTVEAVTLEPATFVRADDPFQHVLELAEQTQAANVIVVDGREQYVGMVTARDINTALFQRDALPLLLVRDLMRVGVPTITVHDDLATALDLFANYDTDHLPVTAARPSNRVIGLIGRTGVMRRYQRELFGTP